jgi:Cupin-like domain
MDMSTLMRQGFHISVNDRSAFSTGKLSPISHNYHHHPLMQLDRLEHLAKSLVTTNQCRFINPGVLASSPFSHKARSPDGRSVEQVFRQIDTPGSWLALYDVQTDAEYRQFLSEVMSTVRDVVEPGEKIRDIRGFIFISAPPSVTPFHIDRENNFWLQIRGRKTINVWDRRDRDVVAARDVEDFIAYRSLDNVRLQEEFRARSFEFDCGPGDGVYFPSTTPHMTKSEPRPGEPGNEVAISVGINFYTDITRRNAYVHTANGVLRRFGFDPHPPAHDAGRDRVKYRLGRAIVAWRRLSGYAPPPGF